MLETLNSSDAKVVIVDLRRLDNNDISRDQSRRNLSSSKHKRKVPWNNSSDNTKRCIPSDNLSILTILDDLFGKVKASLASDPSYGSVSFSGGLRNLQPLASLLYVE